MPERRGRKSDSQTPAPPADRIVGSKKNPKGSASSEDSAKKIVLSPTVKNTLKRKLEIFKEKYPKSENVTFEDLKAVYRRGTGAYSSTHRPTITGGVPNSRSAWGIARVNKFLEKAAGEKVKKAYVQDDDLLKYENGGLVGFNEDFKKWHKKVNQKINVFISSIHDLNKPVASPDHNSVILHLFEKNDETIDAKVHLKELTDLADKHKITIYLQPIPSHKNLSESKKKKITKDYLKSYYEKFGFIEVSDGWMERKPHSKYEDGGLTHSLEMAMTNLKKNGIVIKHDGITLIAYNTGNHERQPSLYRKAIMYDAIHPKKQAAEIIEKFDKGQYENFDENEIQEYKNSHLIIINQNEVIYDSNNPNMMYEDGGETEKQIALPDTYATPSSLKRVLNNQGYDLIDKNLESNENKIEIMDFKNDLTVSDIDKKYHKYSHEFINKQLINGIKVEMEHTDKPEIARKIALDHLNENILYYEYLEEMEQKMENQKKIDDHFEEIFKDGGKIDPIFSFKTTTGEPTRLNYIQQILIRTSKFKQFFGDWETAAKSFIADGRNNFDRHFDGVSKIVDSVTLEPRVVYHGTMSEKEFFQFDVTREKGVGRPYAYFAFNKEYSENFTLSSQRGDDDAKPVMYQVFLNVRHPFYALGKEFENKEENAEHWIELITDRIYFDKYKRTQRDEFHQALKSTIYGQVGSYVNKVFPADIKQKFWRLMSFDANKEFKYFLIAYGYDGVIYDEEISSMYNVKNPAQYTKAVTIFDARQVKLADGRNTNFDALSSYIHYDHGGKINKPSPEHIKENHTPMNKKQQLEKMMFGGVFADGGKVKGDGKMHHDAKDGGYFVGHSHADGGIKAINKDTGQIIEVEGNEVIINKRSVADTTKREFEGEMLTNREILSRINEAGGGVSFEDGGQLSCCGKKYKFGGETKEDYVIIYEISQSKDDNTMAKEYLEAVYK